LCIFLLSVAYSVEVRAATNITAAWGARCLKAGCAFSIGAVGRLVCADRARATGGVSPGLGLDAAEDGGGAGEQAQACGADELPD
jgi:hypothetical protein